jgi:hypothetical protein
VVWFKFIAEAQAVTAVEFSYDQSQIMLVTANPFFVIVVNEIDGVV